MNSSNDTFSWRALRAARKNKHAKMAASFRSVSVISEEKVPLFYKGGRKSSKSLYGGNAGRF